MRTCFASEDLFLETGKDSFGELHYMNVGGGNRNFEKLRQFWESEDIFLEDDDSEGVFGAQRVV